MDFVSLMAYDLHGSWENVTGHNSPLYAHNGETGEQRYLNMVRNKPVELNRISVLEHKTFKLTENFEIPDIFDHCKENCKNITKTHLFKYIENFSSKNLKFSDKKL